MIWMIDRDSRETRNLYGSYPDIVEGSARETGNFRKDIMKAMVLARAGKPLELRDIPQPVPGTGQIRIRVNTCGVCRTDLHIVDGELAESKLPLVPGHQIVGVVDACGPGTTGLRVGQWVGVPWLGHTCGQCDFCKKDQENLCDNARFTGYHIDGGFAEYCLANEQYAFPLPKSFDHFHDVPLLCAGLIGYRAFRMTGDAQRIGFFGFGSAAHILVQIAKEQGREVYAFTRPGDIRKQGFALSLGAAWAGDSNDASVTGLDAAIIFAPAGSLVPTALKAVRKGGKVVCAGIHMSDIPSFPYSLLWEERSVCSVANLTRADGDELLRLAGKTKLQIQVTPYPLEQANRALEDLRNGKINGSAVLRVL